MQKKLQLSIVSWLLIVALIVLLLAVRMFQQQLFYDPFIPFYHKTVADKQALPVYDGFRLFMHYFFRYALNTGLSLSILWIMFKDKAIIKLTSVLYAVLFVVLALLLYLVLQADMPSLKLIFYIRRFLMQPLPLLLFVPAFYYQKYLKQ